MEERDPFSESMEGLIWMVSGPNGPGKTTLVKQHQAIPKKTAINRSIETIW